jgi:hypothetical protein
MVMVAEIVATGEATVGVSDADGVGADGSGVITSTLNVQPEIKNTIAISKPVIFFILRFLLVGKRRIEIKIPVTLLL